MLHDGRDTSKFFKVPSMNKTRASDVAYKYILYLIKRVLVYIKYTHTHTHTYIIVIIIFGK